MHPFSYDYKYCEQFLFAFNQAFRFGVTSSNRQGRNTILSRCRRWLARRLRQNAGYDTAECGPSDNRTQSTVPPFADVSVAMTPSADASPTMAGATRRMRPLLGTLVEIGLLPAAGVDAAAVQGTIDLAFAEIGTAHRRWSFHEPDSELSRLNAAAGQWLPVSSATRRLLRLCRRMMLGSEGAFDITLGGRLVREGVLPWHANTTPLPDGNCDDVEIAGTAVRLRRPIALCLDGVAKGFAVDLAIAAIRRHLRDELRGGWVNAGGDLRCFGDVELPVLQRGTDDRPVALGELRDGAVASSRVSVQGSAQRDDFPGQIRGRGGAVPYAGVWTVLARYAWRADALTKVAANTAPASRQRMVARLGGQLLEVAA